MFILRAFTLFLITILAVCFPALGQTGSYATLPLIRAFSPLEYQSSNQNWAIDQTSEGYLLVGNNGGLLEFDGSSWSRYPLPGRQIPRSIALDRSGSIYTGGYETFGKWERDTEEGLVYRDLGMQTGVDLIREEVWHILPTSKGVIFQSFSSLFLYNGDQIIPIRPPGNVMFLNEVNGRYYLQLIDGGIYELKSDYSFELLPSTGELSSVTVSFILPGPGGALLIGTNNGGCFLYQEGQLSPWKYSINSQLAQYQLNKGVRLKSGGYAFGTVLNGVYIVNEDFELLYHINKSRGLQNNTVLSLHEDRDGNLWVGLDKGIDMIQLSNPIRFYKDQQSDIGAIYGAEYVGGRLYVGSNQGLFRWENKGGKDGFQIVNGTQGQVWELQNFDELLCGHNKGTFSISGDTSVQISEISGGWMIARAPHLEDVLIQGTYSGLIKYQKSEKGWEMAGRIEGFSEPVKQLHFDKAGYLWVVHPQRGLSRLLLDSGWTTAIEIKSFGPADGLLDNHKVRILSVGDTFAIMSNCLYAYHASSNSFECMHSGLASEFSWFHEVNQTSFGKKSGSIWIGENGSMFQQPQIRLIDGFERILYLPEWGEGMYFFCMEDGFAVLPRERIPFISQIGKTGKLHIKNISIFGANNLESRQVQKNDNKFAHNENSITFQFALPIFDQKPSFRYRLIGFDSQWVPYSTQSFAAYQNLASGKYIFEVQAESGNDVVRFPFEITAPWYLRNWTFGIYAVLFLLFFFGTYRYLLYRIQLERADFERKRAEEERLRQEQEARERLEQEVALKSRELAHAAMSQVRRNEVFNLIKEELKHSIKDPSKSRAIISKIDEQIESDQDWNSFVEVFNNVHDDFFKKLQSKHPTLTPGDLKLAAYLRLNLSTKEIAPLLNLSVRSVENKRYRLRKKLLLGEDDNLTEYIMGV